MQFKFHQSLLIAFALLSAAGLLLFDRPQRDITRATGDLTEQSLAALRTSHYTQTSSGWENTHATQFSLDRWGPNHELYTSRLRDNRNALRRVLGREPSELDYYAFRDWMPYTPDGEIPNVPPQLFPPNSSK